ncbi:MAG: hypothetical protein P4L56_13760 [Candidatus Sulfopaludibacter sp.]|nr:hypothetical protein [Candidatus Sulfopaludibacter sp.]
MTELYKKLRYEFGSDSAYGADAMKQGNQAAQGFIEDYHKNPPK